ncbi:MAG: hypothetical protein ACTSR0_04055 [Candidatus Asgardarchaeia archaeon]
MIFELLPLLQGWRWHKIDVNTTITRGSPKYIYKKTDEAGWLLGFYMYTNVKEMTLEIITRDVIGGDRKLSITPSTLNARGEVSFNMYRPYLAKYDASGDNYVVIYNPLRAWGYRGMISVKASIPATSSSTSGTLILDIRGVVIENYELFKSSLKKYAGDYGL